MSAKVRNKPRDPRGRAGAPGVPMHQLPWLLDRWRETLRTFVGPESERKRMEQMVSRLEAHLAAMDEERADTDPAVIPQDGREDA